jgi:hypothetical protein
MLSATAALTPVVLDMTGAADDGTAPASAMAPATVIASPYRLGIIVI